ncbi:MAG: ABC transporter ATP-binding protein, partial [Slackia sp.]|nr:ABC transporter ATP-binding protein [Slackia sp.]
ATAYADPENEALVERAVGRLIEGKTLVVIAHRLFTIRNAQQILVVDGGRVVAHGTHEELLAGNELYGHMWSQHMSTIEVA